eukprot:794878-Pyramimonas_sp.AAC.1
MSMHFFSAVTNVGSWLEIGNSLSRFGILNSQVRTLARSRCAEGPTYFATSPPPSPCASCVSTRVVPRVK